MDVGEHITLPGRKGWFYEYTKREEGFDVKVYNPTKDGKNEMFFTIDTSGNLYGAPEVIQETTLGIPCKNVGVNIDGNVIGALVVGASGKIDERFSWTNVVLMKNLSLSISEEGELLIDSKSKGFLRLLFLPDKNRMKGYVGVFTPTQPKQVKIIEMEDLLLEQLLK
ncbi:hypothetical protein K8R66_01195 [bacterium]|nr:hypothetical protein [bacterium]